MAIVPTLHWSGPADATTDDEYIIRSDMATVGVFAQITSQAATAPYASPVSTLVDDILSTSVGLELVDATNFADEDLVLVGVEPCRLGGKSSNTFAACERAIGWGIAEDHAAGTVVRKLHESYEHAAVSWGEGRFLIRYHVVRRNAEGDDSIAAEALAFNPPPPPNTKYITIFVPVIDTRGASVSGVSVSLTISDTDNYTADGELIYAAPDVQETSADGVACFFALKDAIHRGGDAFTITIAAGTPQQVSRQFLDVPDLENYANFLAVMIEEA